MKIKSVRVLLVENESLAQSHSVGISSKSTQYNHGSNDRILFDLQEIIAPFRKWVS